MKTNAQNNPIKNGAYIALVERIYNENNKPQRYNGTLESMLYEFFSKTSKKKYTWKRETFKRLLIHLYNQRCFGVLRDYNCVTVLHNMSAFGNKMIRPIEEWSNTHFDVNEQLNALLRHCFTVYDTPQFLEASFRNGQNTHMLWYIQLGKGKSVKDLAQMPIQLTSKMAHAFTKAPAFLTVNEALRYAQAIGFGASTKVAKQIAMSRLSIIRDGQEEFWATVVQFFSKANDVNIAELDGIVDYITFKYREDASFSMKNRTYNALLNQSQEWHRLVYQQERGHRYSWESSGIKPLFLKEIVDNKTIIYKTEELLNSDALFDEGNAMQHCVSEYDEDCEEGRCTIFSLRQEVEGQLTKRLATLEIELPSYELVQAKARCNQEPDSKSRELINQWINNSQVTSKAVMDFHRQNEPRVYDRMIERRQMTEGSGYDSAILLKVIFWILYFILKAMMFN